MFNITRKGIHQYDKGCSSFHQVSVEGLQTYNVAGWKVSNRILSSKGSRAEHDENQDEVGEYMVINESVAKHTDPGGKKEFNTSVIGGTISFFLS